MLPVRPVAFLGGRGVAWQGREVGEKGMEREHYLIT